MSSAASFVDTINAEYREVVKAERAALPHAIKCGEKFQVRVSEIFVRWQDWCAAHNTRHGWGSNQFSEKLRSVLPTLTSGRPRKDNPERLTVLYGVGLKKKVPLLERTF